MLIKMLQEHVNSACGPANISSEPKTFSEWDLMC